ncbi:MAG TPA: hypothetical protein VKI19_09820 [Acidimicrobiales bacterium]|nr:hypothetical protein [Acidimicrobiales bacterium]
MRDLNEPAPMSQAAFDTMIRRYLMKVAGRYVPVLAVAAAVVLVFVFVPTKQPGSALNATGDYTTGPAGSVAGSGSAGSAGGTGAGGAGSNVGGNAGAAGGPAAVNGSTGGASGSYGSGAGGSGGPSGSTATGTGPAAPSGVPSVTSYSSPSLTGVARTGVRCGSGARQFIWSEYAPWCQPAFSGDNGGATANGVTRSTVTLTFRLANSAQQTAIDSLAGAANINQDDMVKDLQSYIAYFNTQFELYGRHVVLKTYQGQGDYIEEDQGQGLGATQADAVNVRSMGAFGDVTFALTASQPYEEDLAAEHVIGFSSVGMSQEWFQQHAPYEYSVQGPSGTNAIQGSAAVVCRRMAGMNAIFAGSPTITVRKRVFGVIYPQTPVYTAEVAQWKQLLASQCHVTVAKTVGYSINVADYEAEAANAMAQLNAAHVTTVLCACDPIADIFLSNAADNQQYYPEWFASYFGDPIGRNYDQKEWAHAVTGGWQWPSYTTVEPYRTFERGYPGRQPAETPPSSPRYYYDPYYTLLQIFDALQAAGPDLTPYTFEQGMFSVPSSAPGDYIGGQWKFGPDVFDPIVSYTLNWWSPTAVSNFDGTKGAYLWCNAAQSYTIFDPSALGPPGHQLACFGK